MATKTKATTVASTVPYVRDCVRCAYTEAPIVCSRCQCVAYCSAAHQQADTARHRKQCKPVVDARKEMERQEKELLRDDPYVFDSADGWFYLIFETRPYMRAKYQLIQELTNVGTFLATEYALKEAREALFLNQQDNLAIRDIVPGLLLLLGRLQEAYDFIRFWTKEDEGEGGEDDDGEDGEDGEDEDDEGEEPDEEDMEMDMGMDMDMDVVGAKSKAKGRGKAKDKVAPKKNEIVGVAPCFTPTGSDMTESLDVFTQSDFISSVFHKCALTYIKTVLAHALTGAIRTLSDDDPTADESAKADVLAFLTANKMPTEIEELRLLQVMLEAQAKQAFHLTHESNGMFWGPLQNPKGNTICVVGAPVHPRAGVWRMETSAWILPYSELWRAEPYKMHFLYSTMFPEYANW